MHNFFDDRISPQKRRSKCKGAKERHLTEGAVIVAFGLYLVDKGASEVELYPDGQHLTNFDIRTSLESRGFELTTPKGRTNSGGTYTRGSRQLEVTFKPGMGDVVASLNGKKVLAECKGGVINTEHTGQLSRLRRGLCEAVGQLVYRANEADRRIAVLPACRYTLELAQDWEKRARAVGIELALVDEMGKVSLIARRDTLSDSSPSACV
jgi:hypothetical protein